MFGSTAPDGRMTMTSPSRVATYPSGMVCAQAVEAHRKEATQIARRPPRARIEADSRGEGKGIMTHPSEGDCPKARSRVDHILDDAKRSRALGMLAQIRSNGLLT